MHTGLQRHYKLRPSRRFSLLLLLLCVFSAAPAWVIAAPVNLKLLLIIGAASLGFFHFRLDAELNLQRSCVALRLKDQHVVLVLRNGEQIQARVLPSSFVSVHFLAMNVEFTEKKGKRTIVIMPDAMSADSFRSLRIALLWSGQPDQMPI